MMAFQYREKLANLSF